MNETHHALGAVRIAEGFGSSASSSRVSRGWRGQTMGGCEWFCMLVFAALLLAGCSKSEPVSDIKPPGAHFSRKEAISMAKDAIEGLGKSVHDYSEPNVRFQTSGDKTWAVLFDGKGAHRDQQMLVLVDDESGHARCFEGTADR